MRSLKQATVFGLACAGMLYSTTNPAHATNCGLLIRQLEAYQSTASTDADGLFSSLTANESHCGDYLTEQGTNGQFCHWPFPYRDAAANRAFSAMIDAVSACATRLTPDAGVNHPDSYDLRQYELGNLLVSLSLKDKGARQQTLIFLRLEPQP